MQPNEYHETYGSMIDGIQYAPRETHRIFI